MSRCIFTINHIRNQMQYDHICNISDAVHKYTNHRVNQTLFVITENKTER